MSQIKVPRMLVQRFLPHPEVYGEAFVLLDNGMVTDVYTTDSGELITITNDRKLIKYLGQAPMNNNPQMFFTGEYILNTIAFKDIDELIRVKSKTSYSLESLLNLDKEGLRMFISHTNTMFSHTFTIRKENMLIGIMGYDLFNQSIVINIDIFDVGVTSMAESITSNNDVLNLLIENLLRFMTTR